jgi:hypothetical protein
MVHGLNTSTTPRRISSYRGPIPGFRSELKVPYHLCRERAIVQQSTCVLSRWRTTSFLTRVQDQINTQGEGTQCDPSDEGMRLFFLTVCELDVYRQTVFDTWDEFNRRSFDDESEFPNSTDTGTRLRRSLRQ